MMRKLVIEAIGTFFLVLTVALVAIEPGAGAMAPLAIGAVLMCMVYMGGHISGGHYNPAVTLAVFLRGRATATELGGYWVAQHVAAALAVLAFMVFRPEVTVVLQGPEVAPALLAELLFTFALAFVVLNVATVRGTEGNSYYGLAIGFTVMVGAYAVGPISGAAFNPAVAIGAAMLGQIPVGSLWIYLLAGIVGGGAAGVLFNVLDLGNDRVGIRPPAEPQPDRQLHDDAASV